MLFVEREKKLLKNFSGQKEVDKKFKKKVLSAISVLL